MKTVQETGIVIKVENQTAWVNTQSKLACTSCKVESTCGNGMLEKYLANRLFVTELPNSLNAEVGDWVTLSIPVQRLSKAALLVYGLPILLLFLFSWGATLVIDGEGISIGAGLMGLVLGFWIVKLINIHRLKPEHYTPKMIAKAHSGLDAHQLTQIKIVNL